jgi:hypothetical protein
MLQKTIKTFYLQPAENIEMEYEKLLNTRPDEVLRRLVTEIQLKKAVDVRFEFTDNDQWSVVNAYVDDQDDELALRLHPGDQFELYIGYYDAEDELHELTKILTEEQKKIVPKSLQKVMTKVLNDEEGLRVPGGLMEK